MEAVAEKTTEVMDIPALRFPEFEGEWKENRLRELTKINQGLQIAISDRFTEQVENSYFYITNEFLRERSQKKYYIKNPPASVLCKEKDLLMTRTGNTGLVVTGVNGAFHNNFFKIKYDHKLIDKWFLYYFLKSHKTQSEILKLAGTSTIPDLNHGDFYRISIKYPSLLEQQKIASYILKIDNKIQQLTRKKELLDLYKKGVMQQIFSQQIRFKDENGQDFPEWDEKFGNLVFENISDKNHNSDLPILAITQEHGAIPRDMIDYQVTVSDKSVNSYKVVQKGDYIISLRSFQGGIEYSNYKGICSPAYIILRPKIEVNRTFYKYYLKTDFYITQLNKNLEGIRDGKMISYKYFSEIQLPYPSIEEQTKIANFVSSLDEKIAHCQVQIKKTQQFKKGLLQQMFV